MFDFSVSLIFVSACFNKLSTFISCSWFNQLLFNQLIVAWQLMSIKYLEQTFWLTAVGKAQVFVADNIKNCSGLFKCQSKPGNCDSDPAYTVRGPWNWSSYMESFTLFILLVTPVFFLQWHVNMSTVKKTYYLVTYYLFMVLLDVL